MAVTFDSGKIIKLLGETQEALDDFSKQLATVTWFDVTNVKTIDQVEAEATQRLYAADMLAYATPLSSQMFEDAVAHIDTHGWCQGDDVNEQTGQVCAQGAFGLFTVIDSKGGLTLRQHDLTRTQVFSIRVAEIMDLMGIETSFGSVIAWNDAEGRTKEQVIDALTLGAKKLRDQGR